LSHLLRDELEDVFLTRFLLFPGDEKLVEDIICLLPPCSVAFTNYFEGKLPWTHFVKIENQVQLTLENQNYYLTWYRPTIMQTLRWRYFTYHVAEVSIENLYELMNNFQGNEFVIGLINTRDEEKAGISLVYNLILSPLQKIA
jgi:hypothetical protein